MSATPLPRLHTLNFGPEDLPPVLPKDLRRSWHAAHVGAEVGLVMAPGDVEGVVFRRAGRGRTQADETRFLFSDLDGACWAAAVGRLYSLSSTQGISLLFRLLALIELMSDTPWLRPFFSLSRTDGAVLDAKLIAVAAAQPLSATASFEPAAFKIAMGLAEHPARVMKLTAVKKAKKPVGLKSVGLKSVGSKSMDLKSGGSKSPARRKAAREGTRRGSARGTRPR